MYFTVKKINMKISERKTWLIAFFQVEADLGYPGGKAKIIHKESDIIMAFAINKVKYCTYVLV